MESNQEEQVFPDWLSNSGLDFWQPDELYIEWLQFLFGIWEKIEYL